MLLHTEETTVPCKYNLSALGNQNVRVAHVTTVFALLRWLGTKPTDSLRHACIFYLDAFVAALPRSKASSVKRKREEKKKENKGENKTQGTSPTLSIW